MESIKVAIERAKRAQHRSGADAKAPSESPKTLAAQPSKSLFEGNLVSIDGPHLHEMRIVGHDAVLRHSSEYDMLRTQVLQGLQELKYKTIAITSPSPGCGKTVTAINLALSMARQVDQRVLLVDLDLRKPQIANYLGIRSEYGLADVLAGACSLANGVVVPSIAAKRLAVLPLFRALSHSSELLVSPSMKELMAAIGADVDLTTVIFDLPPMLSSDDFLAFLPQVDCALLIAEAGQTSERELKECERLIDAHKMFGCVLNKTRDQVRPAYY